MEMSQVGSSGCRLGASCKVVKVEVLNIGKVSNGRQR